MKNELIRKIKEREIIAAVIGLGYVGLPLAVEKAKAGFKTIGFDIQEKKSIWSTVGKIISVMLLTMI